MEKIIDVSTGMVEAAKAGISSYQGAAGHKVIGELSRRGFRADSIISR